MDDYYLNVLDWGSNNVLAVALGSTLYLWSADTGKVRVLMEVEEDHYLSSVAWGGDGNTIAVGTSNSDIQIWDCKTQRKVSGFTFSTTIGCLDHFWRSRFWFATDKNPPWTHETSGMPSMERFYVDIRRWRQHHHQP